MEILNLPTPKEVKNQLVVEAIDHEVAVEEVIVEKTTVASLKAKIVTKIQQIGGWQEISPSSKVRNPITTKVITTTSMEERADK
jgi:hypothetical protein